MATVKFLVKGKNNPQTIYLRLRDGRTTDITTSTGITIHPNHWSSAKHWISPKADFQNKLNVENDLRKLESLVHSERNSKVSKGEDLDREWLDSVIDSWQGKDTSQNSDKLVDVLEYYKTELPNRVRNGKKGVSAGSIRNYNTTISRLKKFEEHRGTRIMVTDLDFNFHTDYLKFASNKLGLALNSIGKDIRNIKTVCLDAKERGIVINEQVLSRKFSPPSEKTIFTTLSQDELSKIKDFSGPNYLENARDWLLIGCWTGCRAGDLMNLKSENVREHKSGIKVIQYTQSKTGKLVNVPMHADVEEILKRLDGFPRPISTVHFNEYIKEVCKKAGLTQKVHGTRQNPETHRKETGYFEKWQLIRSHTCRRSFATNHYNKLPNKMIMAVTGHSTEKMLLNYIGETEIDHVEDFVTFWKNDNTENHEK